jgi:TnpA family transposase
MPLLKILTDDEQLRFETPPLFTGEERKHFFVLPKCAEEIVSGLRTPASKVGFILQMGYFKATKMFFLEHKFHRGDIEYVARRLPGGNFNLSQYDKTTRLRHRKLILEKFGYQTFTPATVQLLLEEINFLLSKQTRLKDVFEKLLQTLEQEKIEIPSYYRLADLITEGFRAHEKRLLAAIERSLWPEDRTLLDDLLHVDQAYGGESKQDLKIKRYAVTLLKRPNQSTKPAKIKVNIHDLRILRELFRKLQRPIAAFSLSTDMIWHYATVVIKTEIFQIARRDERRYLYLLCFIIHQYFCLQDLLIDIVLKTVQTADNKARRKQKETYFARRSDRGSAAAVLVEVVESAEDFREKVAQIVLSGDLSPEQKVQKLEALVKQDQGDPAARAKDALSLLKKDSMLVERDGDYYDALQEESLWLQKRASDIIKQLSFNAETSRTSIIEAIDHFVATEGKIGEHPPIAFLNKKEQQMVLDSHNRVRVSLYKLLLFQRIAGDMKSGGLNLKHSYRYRSLNEYMIAKALWTQHRDDYLRRAVLAKFANCEAVLTELAQKLDIQYHTTNKNILSGANRYTVIHGDHQFTITTPKQEETHEPLTDLFPQTRFVSLCEVLATIQNATGFLDAFAHLQMTHIHPRPAEKLFYAGITGLGCNITLTKLAQISREISQGALERAVLNYFSHAALLEASNIILAFAKKLPLSHIFDRPDGMVITTSDGQKYPVHGETLLASRSYKYFGKDEGITAYTFRDMHDFLYHSTVFSPSDREAMYVIDGMMHNTIVQSDMHAVDTHGVTPLTFTAMHFLSIFFAPRISRLDERKLSSFVKRKVYQEKGYKLLPDNTINTEVVQEHWDDILRFMATIILKETPASQLFERLNSYSHQHPLYKALKEFGNIIETMFILRYIDEPDIRQAVEKELNKLEHTNKFAKAVFHDNNHEFRQETRDEQLIAEGCKRLIENAIILWNYLYLSEKVADTSEGKQRDELLHQIKYSSMASWQHINLIGEYDFSDERVNTVTQFSLSRILALQVS